MSSLNPPPAPAPPQPDIVDPVDLGEIAVWYRWTESLSSSDLQAIDAVLSDEERVRRDRFVFEHDRRDFAAAHALLRTVLSTYEATPPGEWRFERDRHGKPFVSPPQAGTPPLAFNLSHTRGCVCCAIARAAIVGVDVERLGRITDASQIAERYFAAEERTMLKACGADESRVRFVELWSLKESYIKAIGLGLGIRLDSFSFLFDGAAGLRLLSADSAACTVWLAAPAADARIAVSLLSPLRGRWRISFHDADGGSQAVLLRSWTRS